MHVSGLGWRLLSFFIHCGATEYRLGFVGHLGVHTLYNGLKKAVRITEFVRTLLINCNKYGHTLRLDIKLPSDHSNICTQRKLHNHTNISITTKYEGVYGYAASSMYVTVAWRQLDVKPKHAVIFNRIGCFDGPDFLNHYIQHFKHAGPHTQRQYSSKVTQQNCTA
jgi:hypothetical protein